MKALPTDQILCGDCLTLFSQIPDESIHLVMTSPPYFQQRDYGGGMGNERQLDDYLNQLLKVFKECRRVLVPDGNIVFNLGDKYEDSSLLLVPYRFAIRVTEHFSDIRLVNEITWVKRNPTPRQFRRRLVSSTEPFFHFAKSNDYTYDIDAFMDEERPARTSNPANSNVGKGYFDLIEKSELTADQKKQARLELHDVIQEVKTGELEGFRMKIRGIHSEPFGGQPGGRRIQLEKKGFTIIRIHGRSMKRDVIETAVESLKGVNHPAMYPVSLVQELILLLSHPGDIVLDPFIGSGSTAVAAKQLDRRYIGMELNPDYCQIAQERLADPNTTLKKVFL